VNQPQAMNTKICYRPLKLKDFVGYLLGFRWVFIGKTPSFSQQIPNKYRTRTQQKGSNLYLPIPDFRTYWAQKNPPVGGSFISKYGRIF